MFHYRGAPVRHIAIMQDELQGVSAACIRQRPKNDERPAMNQFPPTPVRAFSGKKDIFEILMRFIL